MGDSLSSCEESALLKSEDSSRTGDELPSLSLDVDEGGVGGSTKTPER